MTGNDPPRIPSDPPPEDAGAAPEQEVSDELRALERKTAKAERKFAKAKRKLGAHWAQFVKTPLADGEAVLLRRSPWAWAPAILVALGGLWVLSRAVAAWSPLWFVPLAIVYRIWKWCIEELRTHSVRGVRGRPSADERRILFDGAPLVDRARIRAALVVPSIPSAVRLHLRRALFPIDLVVPDEEHAGRLIEALGLDPTRATAEFRTKSQFMCGWDPLARRAATYLLGGGAIAALFGATVFPLVLVLVLLLLLAVVLAALTLLVVKLPGWVRVGRDGVALRWCGLNRFIAYGDIKTANISDNAIVIHLESGGTVRVTTAGVLSGQAETGFDALALLNRIVTAKEAHERGGGAEDSPAQAQVLAREGRTLLDWIHRLRELGRRASPTYRTQGPSREALWGIVEDIGASPTERCCAAIALTTGIDTGGRERLQRIAASSAHPKLRIALDAVGDASSDREMEAALEELSAEQEATASRAARSTT